MKRLLLVAALAVFSLAAMTGCGGLLAMTRVGPGFIYTSVKEPEVALAYNGPTAETTMKRGEASITNILGIAAIGDASIQKAMREAEITKIHHVDHRITNILGLFTTYTVYVYGE